MLPAPFLSRDKQGFRVGEQPAHWKGLGGYTRHSAEELMSSIISLTVSYVPGTIRV